MSIHINNFIDRVRAAELRQQRDIIMPLREAQNLHADISKLLTSLVAAQEELEKRNDSEVIEVELKGGSF